MKRILFLSTGGTIASTPGKGGLAPSLTAEEILARVPGLVDLCSIECKSVLELDSTNIQPEHWQLLARETFSGLNEYDGVVIAHGTDTMAYTSSMLAFMLRNLDKPVILTGSQLPFDMPHTDAGKNLLDAFRTAVHGLPGVYLVFNGRIIRGARASKVRTAGNDAFESINCPATGYINAGKLIINYPPPTPNKGFSLDDILDPRVFLLKLIPGTNPAILQALTELGYKGLVIESFGSGGLPSTGHNFLAGIKKITKAGLSVVVSTQCLYGGTDLSIYDVGVQAAQAGAISGKDMTTEAIVTKLMWILGHTKDPAKVEEMMLTDYCGEITAAQ